MSDRLYFSCNLRRYDQRTALREFEKMLVAFPFSKLARRGPVLRVYAIERVEPPLLEREFPLPPEPPTIVEAAREFWAADCATEVDTFWDLWQWDGDWSLKPASLQMTCFGPDFDNEQADHLRIEFGPVARFLPAGIEGGLHMGQSNLKSLLKLIHDLEATLEIESRAVWSESGANFADLLKQALGDAGSN